MKARHLLDKELQAALTNIYNTRISGGLGRRILATLKSYDAASESFVKTEADLRKSFTTTAENGDVSVFPEKTDEFNKEYVALLDQEYSVTKLSVDDIEDIPSISAREIQLMTEAGLVRALN